MIDIYELENRWKRYKIKSYIPYAVIGLSSFVIIVSSFYLYSSFKTANIEKSKIVKFEKPKIVQKVIKRKEIEQEVIKPKKIVQIKKEIVKPAEKIVVKKYIKLYFFYC